MSGIFPKAYNQLHLLQLWYFLCPVYTITASTEAVLPLSVSMNISWHHQFIAPLPHCKHFQPQRITVVLALLQYCIDCDKWYEKKEYTFLIAFLCILVFDEITANCVEMKTSVNNGEVILLYCKIM